MNETVARLDDLQVFAALAEAGSFTGAAELLSMPKQTVSRRIKALEDALRVRLVHRTTRTVRLTEAGRAYADRCTEVVRLAAEAEEAVTRQVETPTGTLRITTSQGLAEGFLAPLLARYLDRHPQVSAEVLVAERRVDLVAEGFDIAVRVGRLDDSTLVARRVGPARVRYCAAPSYLARRGVPSRPSELAAHDTIVHSTAGRPGRWPFREGPVAVEARLMVNDVRLQRRACLDGLGIALLPEPLVADALAGGALVPVLDEHVPDIGGIWLLTPGRRYLAARVRAFLELTAPRDPPGSSAPTPRPAR